ncbi:hypothetical protein FEI15_08315 [Lacticaseibacillus zeae]|uniref:Uncharacterized protein n=1 Tax=Lacticaseibacillus zeae TaxID=57037 RepID=A0A5R8LP73_LACZE|nr:hypothetical protein FEI15_08315 [Lacticaseibacillus zeae]
MAKDRPSRPRPLTLRFLTGLAHAQKKMASRFDLLNADAPIVTNSPWFGTVLEYSTVLVVKTRVAALNT